VTHFSHVDLAQVAGGNAALHLQNGGQEEHLLRLHEEQTLFPGQGKEGAGVGSGGGAGLFADHMLAVFQGGLGQGIVLGIDGGDVNDVDLGIFQKLCVAAVGRGDLPKVSFFPGFFQRPGGYRQDLTGIRLPESGNKSGRNGRGTQDSVFEFVHKQFLP